MKEVHSERRRTSLIREAAADTREVKSIKMATSRTSLRTRAVRKESDEEICDFETPSGIGDNIGKRKRTQKIEGKDSNFTTDSMSLRPRRNCKALIDDIYDYDTKLKNDIDDDEYNENKHQKIKKQKNNVKTEELIPTTSTKEATPIPVVITSVTKEAGKKQTKPAATTESTILVSTTKAVKKRMKKYDYFDKMSDDLILDVFKFIAKPHVKGPLNTVFENVYQLCQFRYISVRMSNILSKSVICMTLLSSSETNLLKQIRAEKLEMGNCCLSTCKDVYRLYEKDLMRYQPLLRRNPHYRSAAPMKLYSKFLAVKLCLKKYGSYEKLHYYQEKKKENRINKRVTQPSFSNDRDLWGYGNTKNDDDDIFLEDEDEFEDDDDNIPFASYTAASHGRSLNIQ